MTDEPIQPDAVDTAVSWRRMLDNAPDMVLVHRLWKPEIPPRMVDANETTCRLLGYSRKSIARLHLPDLVEAEDVATIVEESRFLAAGQKRLFRVVMLTRSGERIPAEWHCRRFDAPQWDLPVVFTMARDMRMRSEVEIELLESERRFRQLAEHIAEVFWLANGDRSEILYVSPAYEGIWMRSREDLMNDPDAWFNTIHPADRLAVLSQSGKESEAEVINEYRIVRPDDSVRWIRERAFPIKDRRGHVYRIAGVAADITEEKRLQQESEMRLQQMVQADRLAALGEVVAGVAHEINNPNSFITYNIPILKETWEMLLPVLEAHLQRHPGAKVRGLPFNELMQDMTEIIDAIRSGSERINRVVTNLKDFARLDESAHFQPVELNEVVNKAMTIVGAQLRKTVSTIEVHLADSLPAIEGHPQKLEQIVTNLLVNAIHAMRKDVQGRVCITTRYVDRLDAILLEIEDNGVGMTPAVVHRLFEPFYTSRRTEGGTGLGLSVSYGLVREHGGGIGVLSRPGQGSRFTIYLPREHAHPLQMEPTILCVDDDRSVLKLFRAIFVKIQEGSLKLSQNPGAVMAFLEDHPEVDMVFSDIMMPGMTGWELLEKIKTRFPLIPVVLFSGHPEAIATDGNRPVEPDAVVEKPFDRKTLIETINTLGRQRLCGF